MRSLARTPFGAIFQTEMLLNSKRVAPYAMAVLFGANAWLWQAKGPAVYYGWATNSDFVIVRICAVFSFMTLPLFTALIMGDPVIRDFRTGIDPLIFSKPISRATYLLGKFFGNFFVLVCCQMAFLLMLLLLQGFPTTQMVVQPARVVPYLKHFLLVVVISHLVLAAFYFTVGTLTRNAKIVYGLAVSFYPLYLVYQGVLLKNLPRRWRIVLDPLLMNWPDLTAKGRSGEWINAEAINQLAFSYNSDVTANRALMVLIAAGCLTLLYARFSRAERFKKSEDDSRATILDLATSDAGLFAGAADFGFAPPAQVEADRHGKLIAIPKVSTATDSVRANLKQLMAALGIELRLLYAERSLVVLVPLATLLCLAGVAYYEVAPDGSYSASYASRTAESLLLFLLAIAVFYTGEAMHRDRELRVEPVLWSAPAPDFVLLLSKFGATLLLSISLTLAVGLAAIVLQLYKGHTPVETQAYLTIYSAILLPSMVFLIAAAVALNVLLRDKHFTYAVSIAISGGLFYLYSQGHNHWLYNPVLYGLWTPADLTGAAGSQGQILTHRIYCLALATVFLSLAHLFFGRESTKVIQSNGRLASTGWSVLILLLSTMAAIITGLMINTGT